MGPCFSAMFISGQKAAHVALNSLRRQAEEENKSTGKKEGKKEMATA